jgi:hypothetical protein
MLTKIEYSQSAPFSFEPPFKANVSETYSRKNLEGTLKDHMEKAVSKDRPLLKLLLKGRNKVVGRFGFNTDFSGGEYGPFEVIYHSTNKLSARYDDPHFNFYCEMINDFEKETLSCYCAVHFITPNGMFYFWSIYLAHVQVFKAFLRGL